METEIEIKATWAGILPMLLAIYEDGETAKARADALGELQRMARTADSYVRLTAPDKRSESQ